ncbi:MULTISPECIES: sporulation protein YabP [Clostridium]|uniref:Sporulation protein YabP n=1 Tax=Clostridium paridis TaxID=2803863 RepID=A0A937K3C9_9CLOT|nr:MULTISPECIES: sporulation protein YabP [Clostridium]MBL4930629.1 sporulation protein YabP [Clostridium paridis]
METKKEIIQKESSIRLENRKKLALTGVLEVLSFDEEKIELNTNEGLLVIKGQELKMNKLDVENGDVIIAGLIYSMIYSGKEVKKEKEALLKRLFK